MRKKKKNVMKSEMIIMRYLSWKFEHGSFAFFGVWYTLLLPLVAAYESFIIMSLCQQMQPRKSSMQTHRLNQPKTGEIGLFIHSVLHSNFSFASLKWDIDTTFLTAHFVCRANKNHRFFLSRFVVSFC